MQEFLSAYWPYIVLGCGVIIYIYHRFFSPELLVTPTHSEGWQLLGNLGLYDDKVHGRCGVLVRIVAGDGVTVGRIHLKKKEGNVLVRVTHYKLVSESWEPHRRKKEVHPKVTLEEFKEQLKKYLDVAVGTFIVKYQV